jgi:polysaccharide export outer membrane protein
MKQLFLPVLVLLLVAGCRSDDPFAPVSVPVEYSVVPAEPIDEADLTAKLLELHKPDTAPYTISAGDQFNISVYEHEELNMLQVVVAPDGYMSMPLVGPTKIGGLTLVEATEVLRQKLEKYIKNPIIALVPYSVSGYNFTIVGRVNYPGIYPISVNRTRLIDAVAVSKGLAQGLFHGDTVELADLQNAYISRNGELLPVDFQKALLRGDPLHNIPLRNGDYIYIPSVMNSTVILLGEVRQPTYVGFKEGMSLLQALPFGRGLLETHSSEIKIIRGGLHHPVVYTVNVNKILEGRAMDFPLQSNDIIYVPPDGLSNWNIMVRKILPSLQGMSMLAGPFGNPSGYVQVNND